MLGHAVRRREDFRLVTGKGRYTDDLKLPGLAYAVFVRSAHAHARIASLAAEEARAAPGVIAVLTAPEAAADGLTHAARAGSGEGEGRRRRAGHAAADPGGRHRALRGRADRGRGGGDRRRGRGGGGAGGGGIRGAAGDHYGEGGACAGRSQRCGRERRATSPITGRRATTRRSTRSWRRPRMSRGRRCRSAA